MTLSCRGRVTLQALDLLCSGTVSWRQRRTALSKYSATSRSKTEPYGSDENSVGIVTLSIGHRKPNLETNAPSRLSSIAKEIRASE